jgi:hypothetical protein
MTTAGWIIMITSISAVTLAMTWCIYKVLSTPGEAEHLHGIEQHTPDQDINEDEF